MSPGRNGPIAVCLSTSFLAGDPFIQAGAHQG